ncbi:protease propeptide/inhibitor [Vararia minispora EC-137]|uniref:Protease propeptide/inhibitor n=1 Tax=Vararia minispora EC-137 TaxID=1314806 RepID=A0ACB8QK90_9AGAM|nr:protease propeptide/inhibitor [Vararia minispora EC-137]
MSGKYIVVFKKGTPKDVIDKQIEDVKNQGGTITNRFDSILLGFSADMPANVVANLQNNLQSNGIDYIEPDQVVTIQ